MTPQAEKKHKEVAPSESHQRAMLSAAKFSKYLEITNQVLCTTRRPRETELSRKEMLMMFGVPEGTASASVATALFIPKMA